MAKKIILESDISGEPDASPTAIGIDGVWHTVDLTEPERGHLRQLIEPYLSVGHRVGPTLEPRRRRAPVTTVEEREKIRAWAREHGHAVADYGMVPKKIIGAYNAAK